MIMVWTLVPRVKWDRYLVDTRAQKRKSSASLHPAGSMSFSQSLGEKLTLQSTGFGITSIPRLCMNLYIPPHPRPYPLFTKVLAIRESCSRPELRAWHHFVIAEWEIVAFFSVLVTDVPKLDYLRFFRLSTVRVADDCERNQPRVLTQKCSMCVSRLTYTGMLTNFAILPYPVHASRGP